MAMTTRFCTRCETDVQDAGGYCLLGHPLALKPLDASLSDLRAEIDQAFEDARLEVAAVVSGTEITQPMRVVSKTPPPPPPRANVAPPRPRRVGPPPPPPPRAPRRVVAQPVQPVPEPQAPVEPEEMDRETLQPAAEAVALEAPAVPQVPEAFVPTAPHVPERPTAPRAPELPEPKAAPYVPETLDELEDGQEFPAEDDVLARKFPVWQELEEASPIIGDPIGAFAPPPHMDWGPDKTTPKLLKRRPSRQVRKAKREE